MLNAECSINPQFSMLNGQISVVKTAIAHDLPFVTVFEGGVAERVGDDATAIWTTFYRRRFALNAQCRMRIELSGRERQKRN
jgi:hypothetical protein